MSHKSKRKSKPWSRFERLQLKNVDLTHQLEEIRVERDDLKRGSAQLVASLNASSEHLKRLTDLCNEKRAEVAELKVVCKTLAKYV